ncbi:hypothetical protein B0H10DRAFT_2225810 [Mycena sp. CBHHK59/15]|nr:hypothetical protein B0H10DRAFT_2240480 [Mycena sp. CBHHK59/15]KAJ6609585.1 hypothetical protein B0H10DRAFT_2225810 [Mycena sp. CBHHK59/15]
MSTGLGNAGEVIRVVVEPNTLVVIAGTATGGSYTQRVTVMSSDKQWLLSGNNTVLMLDGAGEPVLTFPPRAEKAAFILLFEAAKPEGDFFDAEVAPDYKANKHVIDGFATYYTFHSEDGGDRDFNDCTLSVALIAATKSGAITEPIVQYK